MSRMARLVVPDYPHHVTQRGARKQKTFFGDNDYQTYMSLLGKAKVRADAEIWAYCLMPNHVHLVVVPKRKDSLAALFRSAHRTYTLCVNSREGWQGHLWQERFRSFVMDEAHLMAAVRYVELNPVRAGICKEPGEWRWSSYHAHVSQRDDQLVTVRPMLERITDWKQYLGGADEPATLARLRECAQTGRPAGGDSFVSVLEYRTGLILRKRKTGPTKVIE